MTDKQRDEFEKLVDVYQSLNGIELGATSEYSGLQSPSFSLATAKKNVLNTIAMMLRLKPGQKKYFACKGISYTIRSEWVSESPNCVNYCVSIEEFKA